MSSSQIVDNRQMFHFWLKQIQFNRYYFNLLAIVVNGKNAIIIELFESGLLWFVLHFEWIHNIHNETRTHSELNNMKNVLLMISF